MFSFIHGAMRGIAVAGIVVALASPTAFATTLTLDNAYGLPDQTFGHSSVALRFTAAENVTLDRATFVYAGLADTLTLTRVGDPTVLASVAISAVDDPTDPSQIGSFQYLWNIGAALQAGSTYDLTSTATKQLSPSFLLTNAKHGYGDPNADFNAHIDIVGAVFSGSFIPEESWAAFDHLTTTPVPEPGIAILMSSALACFAALRRTRGSGSAVKRKLRSREV